MKIGLRTFKSSLVVFISVMIFFILRLINLDLAAWFSPFFSSIAACFCIHPDKKSSVRQLKTRLAGTFIGGIVGMLLVFILHDFKNGVDYLYFIYLVFVSLGIIVIITLSVKFKQHNAVFVSILTYTSITIGIHTVSEFQYGINRIISTFIGILVAYIVNVYRFPRFKNKETLFVCSLNNLTKDFKIDNTIKYKLNYILEDDVDLVITTHYSEAELNHIINDLHLTNKLIVLNGSSLYDYNIKQYSNVYNFTISEKNNIDKIVNDNNIFTLRYVINDYNKLNIFYNKELPKHYLDIDNTMDYDYTKGNVLEDTLITQYQFIESLENINKIKELFKDYKLTIRKYNNEYYSLFINPNESSTTNQLNIINKDKKKVVSFLRKDDSLIEVSNVVYSTVESSAEVINKSNYKLNSDLEVINTIKKLYYKK